MNIIHYWTKYSDWANNKKTNNFIKKAIKKNIIGSRSNELNKWWIKSCVRLCNPMDCSPPGSSIHGDFPGKHTEVGCHALLQGIFPTQGLNPDLPHYRQILNQLILWWTLGYFHTLAIVNNVAMNIGVHVYFEVSAVELLDNIVVLFLRKPHTIFHSGCTN